MPERTCIACKRKAEQGSFWRVARDIGGRVVLWKGNGRSAYMCKKRECIEKALSKARLERALKGAILDEDRIALKEELICKLR